LSQRTDLARGTINASGEAITIQLIRPEDIPAADRTRKPAVVRIQWPPAPTVVSPANFPEVAAMLTRLFAEAATRLAGIKAGGQP
jgi:hypothetical protein